MNKNMYCYLRWVWIQFPWLALNSASSAALKLRELRKEQELARREKATSDPTLLKGHYSSGNDDANGDLISAGDEIIVSKDNQAMLRLWNVKKSDPTIPVFKHSIHKRLAAIKPRYAQQLAYNHHCSKLHFHYMMLHAHPIVFIDSPYAFFCEYSNIECLLPRH